MMNSMLRTAQFIIDDHICSDYPCENDDCENGRCLDSMEMADSANELAYDVWVLAGCLGLASIGLAFELALGRGNR